VPSAPVDAVDFKVPFEGLKNCCFFDKWSFK
jgi:hypothetical protein